MLGFTLDKLYNLSKAGASVEALDRLAYRKRDDDADTLVATCFCSSDSFLPFAIAYSL